MGQNCKYLLQCSTGTKLEVYDDFLTLHFVKADALSQVTDKLTKGFGKMLGGIGKMGKLGATISEAVDVNDAGKTICFISIENLQLSSSELIIDETAIPISPQNSGLAKQIFDFIEGTRRSYDTMFQAGEIEAWKPVVGVSRSFALFGGVFEVSEELDAYNAYRQKFHDLASTYSERFKEQYTSKVCNLYTFMAFFPKIYAANFEPLVKKAVDILIGEELWNVTFGSFMEQHEENFHSAIDVFSTTLENVTLTAKANQEAVDSALSFIKDSCGKNLESDWQKKAYDKQAASIMKEAANDGGNLDDNQQKELYERINTAELFAMVFADFWRVELTLAFILKQNGKTSYKLSSLFLKENL